MGTILVAMPKIEDSNRLCTIIKNAGSLEDIEICRTSAEILRIANARDTGVIVCTKKVFEMNYLELAGYVPDYFGIIVLTKDMGLEMTSERMVKVMMPLAPREFVNSVQMVLSTIGRNLRKKRKIPPRRSEAEQKLIDNAKGLLIERNGMTEPEAFRYIQKCSMDTGRSMVESAQMILMLNG